MRILAYHATRPDFAAKIIAEGFRLDVDHKSDSGDFGEAIYFTTLMARAKAIGRAILEVQLELENPIKLSQSEAYAFVIDKLGFDTIHGHGVAGASVGEAKKARSHFLALGHDALVSRRGPRDLEIAVYDLKAIRRTLVRKMAI
jgi:hypothetical protein